MKEIAIELRNRFSLTNSFSIDRKAVFDSKANILHTKIKIEGSSKVVCEEGVRLRNAVVLVRGDENLLVLKKNSVFSGQIELFGNGNTISIGPETNIRGAQLLAHNGTSIEIGERCLFSYDIELRTTDSHKIFSGDGKRINNDACIRVEDRVWLGRGVLILKGTTIARGCVVGARSVVTKSLEEKSLAVGIPARVVRTNVSWA